jgi:hypothetical protein
MELREATCLESSATVDAEAGVIRGVKIIGHKSKNGRRYRESALRKAMPLYEGCRSFINHREGGSNASAERDITKLIGSFQNVEERHDGLYGNFHVLKSHPFAPVLLEMASDPSLRRKLGFSHVADGDTSQEGRETIVESITEVRRVDLVADPATTNGLFESTEPRTMTIKSLLESIAATVKGRKVLAEMSDADPAMADVPVEVAAESSPEDQIRAGIMSAVMTKLESADEATLKKVLKALGVSDSVTANLSGEAPAEETPPTDEPPAEESVKLAQKLALLEAKTMLLESDRDASDERVRAVALMPTADRKKLVESWPAKTAPKAESFGLFGERPASSPPANGSPHKADELYESRWAELAKR